MSCNFPVEFFFFLQKCYFLIKFQKKYHHVVFKFLLATFMGNIVRYKKTKFEQNWINVVLSKIWSAINSLEQFFWQKLMIFFKSYNHENLSTSRLIILDFFNQNEILIIKKAYIALRILTSKLFYQNCFGLLLHTVNVQVTKLNRCM